MNASVELRSARARSGLTQAELAERSGTSQATISAYESGRKQPSLLTLSRLLAVTGSRITVEPATDLAVPRSRAQQRRAGRELSQVLALAAALPTRHQTELRYPRLPSPGTS